MSVRRKKKKGETGEELRTRERKMEKNCELGRTLNFNIFIWGT